MFTNYELTKALVAERQDALRHEVRCHRLARDIRRGRRAAGTPKDRPVA